jgi:hypothetical protein
MLAIDAFVFSCHHAAQQTKETKGFKVTDFVFFTSLMNFKKMKNSPPMKRTFVLAASDNVRFRQI